MWTAVKKILLELMLRIISTCIFPLWIYSIQCCITLCLNYEICMYVCMEYSAYQSGLWTLTTCTLSDTDPFISLQKRFNLISCNSRVMHLIFQLDHTGTAIWKPNSLCCVGNYNVSVWSGNRVNIQHFTFWGTFMNFTHRFPLFSQHLVVFKLVLNIISEFHTELCIIDLVLPNNGYFQEFH